MKNNPIRMMSFLFAMLFVLTAFAGCQPTDGVTGTQGKTEGSDTEAPKEDDTPKEPIDLDGYSIIVPKGSTGVTVEGLSAYELKEALAELGISVRVTEDRGSASVGEKVILLGKTAATEGELPEGNQYSITEKNGRIQIMASNYYGYRGALSFVKTKVKQEKGFPAGLDYTGTAAVMNVKRADGANRVMFYNVLGYDYETPSGADGWGTPAVVLRQNMQISLLSTYAPDVIGLQEYVREYLTGFDAKLNAIGYTRVPTNKTDNNTPMFYRADKVTLVESGFTDFTGESASHNRGVTWAVFKDNETNKQFAVFNTHFLHSLDSNTAKWDTERENNAKVAVSVINTVKAKYSGIPVIFGGDLNTWNVWKDSGDESNRKPYEELMRSQLILASNVSGVETNFWTSTNKVNYTNSCNGFAYYNASKKIFDPTQTTLTYAGKTPYTLDHIFVGNTTKMTLHRHYITVDDLTRRASDHSPVFVDFTVK